MAIIEGRILIVIVRIVEVRNYGDIPVTRSNPFILSGDHRRVELGGFRMYRRHSSHIFLLLSVVSAIID